MNSPITSTSAFEAVKEDFSESLNSALSDFQKEFERVLSNGSNSVSGATTGNSSVYFNEDGTSTFVLHPISEQVSAESTPIDLGSQFISPIFVGEDGTISHDNPAFENVPAFPSEVTSSVPGATTGNSTIYFNDDGTTTVVSHPISEQISAESTPIDLGSQFINPIYRGEDGTISHDNPADNQSGTTEAFDQPHHPIYLGEDGTISHDNPADNQSGTTEAFDQPHHPIYRGEDGTISHQNPASDQPIAIDLGDRFINPIYIGEDGTISHENPADKKPATIDLGNRFTDPIFVDDNGKVGHDKP